MQNLEQLKFDAENKVNDDLLQLQRARDKVVSLHAQVQQYQIKTQSDKVLSFERLDADVCIASLNQLFMLGNPPLWRVLPAKPFRICSRKSAT